MVQEMKEWMSRCVNGWMNGVDVWIDGWMEYIGGVDGWFE